MSQNFDVIVIGAGPGGYIAAIRAAQLGLSVTCIEGNAYSNADGEPRLGGTCLNVGCIPSKALLASSHLLEDANTHFSEHGIEIKGNASIDVATMQKRKNGIVGKMTKGIEFLFKKNKVSLLKGYGSFVKQENGLTHVQVMDKNGATQIVSAQNVIIATGSKARHLPNITVDNITVVDNEGALAFSEVPKKLGVIGAGVIGLELGSVWRRLGAEVTILEAASAFLSAADGAIAKEAKKLFEKQGLKFELGISINDVKATKKGVAVVYSTAAGEPAKGEFDKLIVSVGRVPNTESLNLAAVGINLTDRGFIEVNHDCATSVPGIWAIGDVIPGPMLAHKAEDEGVAVAERIVGQKPHIDYNCVPWVIYTSPEIAWVGQTEEALKASGRSIKTGQFPFMANGRALGMGSADGFVKMIADADTDEVLGVHIIGAGASDLISEAVVAMEFKAASEDIARICHPHPSLSEAVREAALAVDKRTLNM